MLSHFLTRAPTLLPFGRPSFVDLAKEGKLQRPEKRAQFVKYIHLTVNFKFVLDLETCRDYFVLPLKKL